MKRWAPIAAAALLASAMTVAQPAAGLDVSGRFTDDDGNFHEPQIEAIAASSITLGCGSRQFCPAHPVTRAQMASFLVRALGLTPVDSGPFTDVAGSLHRQDINAIAAAGITLGCGQGNFCPDDQVLRDQMASFLARALRLEPTLPRLPLWEGLTVGCTKDGLACWTSAVIPHRAAYRISEGFYNVLPFQPGEEASLVDPGTRFELLVDGAPLQLQAQPVETSETDAVRLFDGSVSMTPGAHTLVARWFWAGSLTRTTTLELWVAG